MSKKNYIPVIPTGDSYKLAYPGNENPQPNGIPTPGTSESWAREDHVHGGSENVYEAVMAQHKEDSIQCDVPIHWYSNLEGITYFSTSDYGKSYTFTYALPHAFKKGIINFPLNPYGYQIGGDDFESTGDPSRRYTMMDDMKMRSVYVTTDYNQARRLFSKAIQNSGPETYFEEDTTMDCYNKTYADMGGRLEFGKILSNQYYADIRYSVFTSATWGAAAYLIIQAIWIENNQLKIRAIYRNNIYSNSFNYNDGFIFHGDPSSLI